MVKSKKVNITSRSSSTSSAGTSTTASTAAGPALKPDFFRAVEAFSRRSSEVGGSAVLNNTFTSKNLPVQS